MSESNLKNKVSSEGPIYRMPKHTPATTGEIVVQYISFRYEEKEMVRLAKQYLKMKQDKYDLDVLNNYITMQRDTFDLTSEVGKCLINLDAYLIMAQKRLEACKDKEEIKRLATDVKKEYDNFINVLNNNTSGAVDAVCFYAINGNVAYPMYSKELKSILTLADSLVKKHPESLKFIIYE